MRKDIPLYCNKIIELAILTLIIVTPLLFSKDTESTFLIPKETFSKSVILFMLGVWLINISMSGRVRIPPLLLCLPLISLILVAAISLINIINSPYIHLSLWDLSNLLSFIILYFIIYGTIRTNLQIERIVFVFILIGGFTALYGVLQYYGIDYFHYWVGNVGRKSMFSTFGNPNFVAEYHIAIIPISLVVFLFAPSLWKKVIGGSCVLIASICLLISQTRGSWVGFGLSIIFLLSLLKLKDRKVFRGARRTVQIIFILAAIILLGFGVADLQSHGLSEVKAVVSRVGSIFTFGDEFRRFVWHATVIMIKEHPFMGVGLGGFKQQYPEYQAKLLGREEYPSYVQGSNVPQAHNEFLQVWAEMGISGIIIVVWLVYAFFYHGITTLKRLKTPYMWKLAAGMLAGCFAVLVHAIASFPFHLASTASVFVPLCSLIAVMGAIESSETVPVYLKEISSEKSNPKRDRLSPFHVRERSNPKKDRPCPGQPFHIREGSYRPPRWILVAQGLIVALTVICMVITIKPIMADISLKLGNALLKQKEWDVAREYITKGISLNPYEGRLHFALAIAYNGKGDDEKSLYELKKSLETFKDVNIYNNLGATYMRKGMADEAIGEWKKAVAVRPDLVDTHIFLGKAYEEKGMLKESEREYKKAIWYSNPKKDRPSPFHIGEGSKVKNGQEKKEDK